MLSLLSAASSALGALGGGGGDAPPPSPDVITSTAGAGTFSVGGSSAGIGDMLPWLVILFVAFMILRR